MLDQSPAQGFSIGLRNFGTWRTEATPFLRPAFAGHVEGAIKAVGVELWTEIEKQAAREAKKAAKLKG